MPTITEKWKIIIKKINGSGKYDLAGLAWRKGEVKLLKIYEV